LSRIGKKITRNRKIKSLIGLILLYLAALSVLPLIGMKNYPIDVYFSNNLDSNILWNIRVPRVFLGYLTGGTLAVCGMVFQSMFRNPLATPFTLGVASGCSAGSAVYLALIPSFVFLGVDGISVFAFAGGGLASLAVFTLTRMKKNYNSAYMLLAGISVTLFFTSVTMIVQYVANFHQTFLIFRWIIGGIENISYSKLIGLLPIFFSGLIVVFFYSSELDLLLIGEEMAGAKGVAVDKVKLILFAIVSFLVSFVVATCGPIAFVGMIVPHIFRLLIGPKHRFLLVYSFLGGGIFLAFCDAVARVVVAPSELPVGIITSFLGGPFFVWVLVKYAHKHNIF